MLAKLRKRIRDDRELWRDLGPAAPFMGCMVLVSTLLSPIFFLLGLPFRIRHALRRRAYRTGYTIDQPPFPLLTWTEYDWWDGEIELAGWADFRLPDSPLREQKHRYSLTVLPTDQTKKAALPSSSQAAAMSHLMAESSAIASAVCDAVLPYYNAAYSADEVFFEDLQPITTPREVRGLLSLHSVHLHSALRDGRVLVGLGFGCAWDEEHGFGVLLCGTQVLDMGGEDVSFSEPASDESQLYK